MCIGRRLSRIISPPCRFIAICCYLQNKSKSPSTIYSKKGTYLFKVHVCLPFAFLCCNTRKWIKKIMDFIIIQFRLHYNYNFIFPSRLRNLILKRNSKQPSSYLKEMHNTQMSITLRQRTSHIL